MIQIALTFHGGCRVIAYPWGSRNHERGGKATHAPDFNVFADVAKALQNTGGLKDNNGPYFPIGSMTDTVYAVDGGMEDWAYAAGFERKPSPVAKYCDGHVDATADAAKSLIFLIETSDEHTPGDDSLGDEAELFDATAKMGHVTRSIRLILRTMELARPDVQWLALTRNGFDIRGSLLISGCLTFANLKLAVGNCGTDSFSHVMDIQAGNCTSVFGFEANQDKTVAVNFTLHPSFRFEDACIRMSLDFDIGWRRSVDSPDPVEFSTPVSHFARVRADPAFALTNPLNPAVGLERLPLRYESRPLFGDGVLYCSLGDSFLVLENRNKSLQLDKAYPDALFLTGCCSGILSSLSPIPCSGCRYGSELVFLKDDVIKSCVFTREAAHPFSPAAVIKSNMLYILILATIATLLLWRTKKQTNRIFDLELHTRSYELE